MKNRKIEILSEPDRLGRVLYLLTWDDPQSPGDPEKGIAEGTRGQVFFGKLPKRRLVKFSS